MNYEPWIIIPGFTFTMISKRISFYTSIIFKRQQLRPRNCNDCPPFRQSLEFPNQLIQLGFSTKILSSLCSMDLVQLLHALTCHRLFFHLDLSSAFCGGDQIFHIRFSLPGGEMTRCNKDTLNLEQIFWAPMFGPNEEKQTMPFSFAIFGISWNFSARFFADSLPCNKKEC